MPIVQASGTQNRQPTVSYLKVLYETGETDFGRPQEPSKRTLRSATRCVQGRRSSLNCQSRTSPCLRQRTRNSGCTKLFSSSVINNRKRAALIFAGVIAFGMVI